MQMLHVSECSCFEDVPYFSTSVKIYVSQEEHSSMILPNIYELESNTPTRDNVDKGTSKF